MEGIEEGEVGYEEAMSWLPSHVVVEALWNTQEEQEYVKQYPSHHHQYALPKFPRHHLPHPLLKSKSSSRSQGRTKCPTPAGSGMQAIFLDSGKKSSGTGVFLPRRPGSHLQSTMKPACSTVLLPTRVVQALNLNVHELRFQISRRQDVQNNPRGRDCNAVKNRRGKDASAQCYVVSQRENSSAEVFLPKEWTY